MAPHRHTQVQEVNNLNGFSDVLKSARQNAAFSELILPRACSKKDSAAHVASITLILELITPIQHVKRNDTRLKL